MNILYFLVAIKHQSRGGAGFSSGPGEWGAWSSGDYSDLPLSLQDYPLIDRAKARLRSSSN